VRWGITWRQESPAIPASLGILGETPNVMVSTGFSVLKVDYANDSIWDDAVVALIAVHPVVEGDGEDDHIAVIMNANYATMHAARVRTTRVCSSPQDLRRKLRTWCSHSGT
jgi:hypothetical protein